MRRVGVEALRRAATAALQQLQYPAAEAAVMADCLMWAQLRGNRQGLNDVAAHSFPVRVRDAPPTVRVVADAGSVLQLDGCGLHGMVAMAAASDAVAARLAAGGTPLVAATLNNIATGTGAIGFWAHRLAMHGYLGVVAAQSPEYVAPYGGVTALFGTNPVAFGFPLAPASRGGAVAAPSPIVVDFAASAITRYAVVTAAAAGSALPAGVAYDAAGAPTTSPAAVLAGGALRTFGDDASAHKSSALAFAVEALAGVAGGGAIAAKAAARTWGNMVLGIDPRVFVPQVDGTFYERMQALAQRVHACKPAPGHDAVRLPGEGGDAEAAACAHRGWVAVPAEVAAAISSLSGHPLPAVAP